MLDKLSINQWKTIQVSCSTLLKHTKYNGDWTKIINDGWRFDGHFNKFYRMVYIGQN